MTWTGLSVEESVRIAEDRDKWRKYAVVWPTLGSRTAKEQNRTECNIATPLRELTCHTGSHSVTCHPAEVTFPPT